MQGTESCGSGFGQGWNVCLRGLAIAKRLKLQQWNGTKVFRRLRSVPTSIIDRLKVAPLVMPSWSESASDSNHSLIKNGSMHMKHWSVNGST